MEKHILISISIIGTAAVGLLAISNFLPAKIYKSEEPDRYTKARETSLAQCAYTWAYHDLPEISSELQQEVEKVIQNTESHATACGEDCLHANGSTSFTAMETDFYIVIFTGDLMDDQELGNLVENILIIVNKFVTTNIPGPKEGFVEITFRNEEEAHIIRVPIQLGKKILLERIHGADLIRALEK